MTTQNKTTQKEVVYSFENMQNKVSNFLTSVEEQCEAYHEIRKKNEDERIRSGAVKAGKDAIIQNAKRSEILLCAAGSFLAYGVLFSTSAVAASIVAPVVAASIVAKVAFAGAFCAGAAGFSRGYLQDPVEIEYNAFKTETKRLEIAEANADEAYIADMEQLKRDQADAKTTSQICIDFPHHSKENLNRVKLIKKAIVAPVVRMAERYGVMNLSDIAEQKNDVYEYLDGMLKNISTEGAGTVLDNKNALDANNVKGNNKDVDNTLNLTADTTV